MQNQIDFYKARIDVLEKLLSEKDKTILYLQNVIERYEGYNNFKAGKIIKLNPKRT